MSQQVQVSSTTFRTAKDKGAFILFQPVSVALREELAAICPPGSRFSCIEFKGHDMIVRWKDSLQ